MVSRRVNLAQRVSSPALGLLVSALREEMGHETKKDEFCRRIGVTPQFLNPMLAGKENPSSLTLETMMRGLGRMVAFPRMLLTDKGFGVDATAMSLPIADRLAFLMREEIASTGETQLQLANRAGVSRFYIRKTLHGEANPSLLSLETMLKGIGLTVTFPKLTSWARGDAAGLEGRSAAVHIRKRHAGGRPLRPRGKAFTSGP